VTTERWAAVDEITALFHALDDPDPVAARAVLTSEVYIHDTSLSSGQPARLERGT
jgi:hypothetical protein